LPITTRVITVLAIVVVATTITYLALTSLAPPTTVTSPTTTSATASVSSPTTPTISQIQLRWGTASAGTTSYQVLGLIADLVSKYLPGYEIIVMPTASSTASTKLYANEELDGCYAGNAIMYEVHTGTGRFAGFVPKRLPVHTFWAYEHEVTIAILRENLGKYKCWSSLNGSKVFLGKSDWDMHVALRAALEALGIRVEHVELETSMVADALQRGIIVATMIPTTSGVTTSPWVKELELAVPLAILNPCPNEIELLKVKAKEIGVFAYAEDYADPRNIFVTNIMLSAGDKMSGIKVIYGFHTGSELPEEVVYRILKVLDEHSDELVKMYSGFALLKEKFAEFQAECIDSLPTVPVHPGLARFLKEKGVWRSEWKIVEG